MTITLVVASKSLSMVLRAACSEGTKSIRKRLAALKLVWFKVRSKVHLFDVTYVLVITVKATPCRSIILTSWLSPKAAEWLDI